MLDFKYLILNSKPKSKPNIGRQACFTIHLSYKEQKPEKTLVFQNRIAVKVSDLRYDLGKLGRLNLLAP